MSPSAVAERLRAAGCVFAEDEARLLIAAARTRAELEAMTGRRAGGEPLEQVIGYAEFCGVRIAVEPGVFVPRRRTEFLAREAAVRLAAWAAGRPATSPAVPADAEPVVLVDLCCGAGAIGAAAAFLAAGLAGPGLAGRLRIELHAADVDPAAVRCARRNLEPAGGHVYQGDLYDPLPAGLAGRVAVLVANVPYVPTSELGLLPPEARLHEPRRALDGGADGLEVLRRVAAAAPRWLAPGGALLSEVSERQLEAATGIMSSGGLVPSVAEAGESAATIVIGQLPAVARQTKRGR